MNINNVVLKIGGSILFSEFPPPSNIVKTAIHVLKDFVLLIKDKNPNAKIAIIIGGGKPARNYIKLAQELSLSSFIQDTVGILTTRINALILMHGLKRLFENDKNYSIANRISNFIAESSYHVLELMERNDIIFAGGYFPGQSTIGPAALTAEAMKAKLLLIATNVPGVFSEDPVKNPSAHKYDELTISYLKKILARQESKPGTYKIMDLVAANIIERSQIHTIIFDARDFQNVVKVIKHYMNNNLEAIKKIGTIIK